MIKERIGNYRWIVVSLLFFATTINYLDRQVLGFLKSTLEKDFNWTETDYSHIVIGFQASYSIGLLFFGWLIDRIGSKFGYSLSIFLWSIASMAHALAKGTFGFGVARSGLGLAESGNFPAAVKTVAEWFPKKERALATGIFNSGTNIGAIVAPMAIPWILGNYGWQQAFIWTGSIGFIWLILWLIFYEIPGRQKRTTAKEIAYINSDQEPAAGSNGNKRYSWKQLLMKRQTWVFITGKFFADPVWYFFAFWLPSYFSSVFHSDAAKTAWPLIIIYSAATLGSIGGGYLSSHLIKRGWAVQKARKTAMLIFACLVLPIVSMYYASNIAVIVTLISLAVAAHQAWSANVFTLASDMFPKEAVSSVVGIGSMAGSVGGILFPYLVGFILQHYKTLGNIKVGYNILFIICGCSYLVGWLIINGLLHNMKPLNLDLAKRNT